MIAVLVVVVLFVKVLDRFGLLAASYDGKETPASAILFLGGEQLVVAELVANDSSSVASEFSPPGLRSLIQRLLQGFAGVMGGVTEASSAHEPPAANWLTHAGTPG